MEFFHINRGRCIRLAFAENPRSPFKKLIPPGLDDIRMDIELGGQLGQRLLALQSSKRHLRFAGRACGSGVVVLSWCLLFTASCRSQAENTLITGVQISRAGSDDCVIAAGRGANI